MERVRTGVASSVDMSRLSKWLEINTAHPKLPGEPWSFKDHEFQIGIVNDQARDLVCRKCSQVGVSELTLRLVLGLVSILPQHTAIYTLPTAGFASKFAKSRFDPVIKASKFLSESLDRDIDNVELKKIGTSFLYILGTYTQTGAISVPADILVHDEVDFSDQQAMTTFSSRLGHAADGGIKRRFSTPTVEGFGISKAFAVSTQAHYGVKCDKCSDTVFPSFMDDVVIPGFDKALHDIDKEDLSNDSYNIEGAWLKCPSCGARITEANLADPSKREWVHKFPDRTVSGYQVFPYDVIRYNPISKTLRSLEDYAKKSDWVNFKVGLPDEDASNSFILEVMENNTVYNPLVPDYGVSSGTLMGVDVGKTSWVVIGKPVDRKIDVIYMERVRQTAEGYLLYRLNELSKMFGVVKSVIDAGPDFTTSSSFVAGAPVGVRYANYYTRSTSKGQLTHIKVNDEEGILTTERSTSFDLLVKAVNAGRVRFCKGVETLTLHTHLRNMKRVESFNTHGDRVINWVSTGDDHYAHALNYMNIAATLLEPKSGRKAVGVLPGITAAPISKYPSIPKVGL